MIQKIISGAQTGADLAGIDAAIESDIKVLNVACRSASKGPGIYDQVKDIIKRVIHG